METDPAGLETGKSGSAPDGNAERKAKDSIPNPNQSPGGKGSTPYQPDRNGTLRSRTQAVVWGLEGVRMAEHVEELPTEW